MLLRLIFAVLAGLSPARADSAHEWNAFIDRAVMLPLEEVEPRDRGPYLAFFYFSEVYNGGHLQYFLNKTYLPWDETADAIETMGATDHAAILREAIKRWRGSVREAPTTVEEYVEIERLGEFQDLDYAMYDLKPELEYFVYRTLVREARREKRGSQRQ
jgi:hypothetical protein